MKKYLKIVIAIFILVLNYSCDALCGDEEDTRANKEDTVTTKTDTLYIERTGTVK